MKRLNSLFLTVGVGFLAWAMVSCKATTTKKSTEPAHDYSDLSSVVDSDEFGLTAPPEKTTQEEDTVSSAPSADDKRKLDQRLLPVKDVKNTAETRRPPFFEAYLKGKEDKPQPFTLNTDALPITDVITLFSDPKALDFSYILDPRIKGAVTMNINTQMTKKELWQLFDQILWTCGAYCSPDPADTNIVHIMPFDDMPKERNIDINESSLSNVQVVLFYIRNTGSKDILEKIRPFLTKGATAIDIPARNTILLVETPANIPKLRELIKLLDEKNKANWPQVVIPCVNVSADAVKQELANLLPVVGFPVSLDGATAEPGSIHLTSIERMQVIIASAANNEAIEEIKRWVNILDRDDVGEQERVYIYKVINNQAEQLLKALEVIFTVEGSSISASEGGGNSGSSGSSSSSSKSSSSNFGNKSNNSGSSVFSSLNAPSPNMSGGSSRPSSSSSSGANKDKPTSIFEVPTKILADGFHNRLVIRSTPRAYAMIKAVLDRLDTVASQVLLQVMIAEVTLDASTEFGLEFKTDALTRGSALTSVGTDYEKLNPGSAEEYGSTFYMRDKDSPETKFAYVRALAGSGNTKMLSCPQIITQSHTPAEVKVGEKVPIVTQENNSQDTTNISRDIQYIDTGILTTITPHVTKGGLITMDIEQTISDARENQTSGIDSPIIQERVFNTTLSLRDGDTLLVGGLIWDKSSDTQSNLPYIINIPVLGRFFGTTSMSDNRVEIVIMITASVINAESNIESMLERYKNSMRELRKFNDSINNG